MTWIVAGGTVWASRASRHSASSSLRLCVNTTALTACSVTLTPPMLTASARVVAVVVTHNRKELLLSCLEALAQQRSPVAAVVIVDTASTDGTADALRSAGVAGRLPVRLVRLARNGGGAEGFHYGIAAALEQRSDWLWLMDDDCEPRPDTLEQLLRSRPAGQPATALLAPTVVA